MPDDDGWPVADETSLEDILVGCRSGRRDSQRRLYERFNACVLRLSARMVGSEQAVDLTQEVFLNLFRNIGKFAGQSRFETWLYRVTVNQCLQHLRRARTRRHVSLPQEPPAELPHHTEKMELQELLDVAMGRIDPELRSIFMLREAEGLSYRDIAQVLKIPEGTVGSRLNRARNELQQHLISLGWDP